MKKHSRFYLVILFATLALLAPHAYCQSHYQAHVHVGFHGGMTLSEMAWSPSVRQSFVTGFTGGVSARYAEERHVGILAELNVSQRGWKENFEELPFSYARRLTYVELPIMTHIFFGSRTVKGFFNLGPEIGLMLADDITANFDYANPGNVEGFPTNNRSVLQMAMPIHTRFDYGITAGAGAEFVIARRHSFTIEGRYYFGLGNIFASSKKDPFSASRGTSIMVTVGYMFRLK